MTKCHKLKGGSWGIMEARHGQSNNCVPSRFQVDEYSVLFGFRTLRPSRIPKPSQGRNTP